MRIFLWQTKFEADKKCMLRKMDKGAVILLVVSATAVSVAGYAGLMPKFSFRGFESRCVCTAT